MSYTATFDASHKVKVSGGHVTNFARHIARDVDQAAGFAFPQRNVNIDPARTSMNITMVNDGNGGWRRPEVTLDSDGTNRPPSAELIDYLNERLGTVKKKVRSDAVILRPLILQLDPKWFAEHNSDWRENGLNDAAWHYIGAQLDWAAGEFSHENLPGFSVHLDETNPQLQLLFTPVTEDGRLSQKDFFRGPGDLQRQHKEHRQALADAGYDVEFKVTERSKEHLSSAELARKADLARDLAERAVADHHKLNEWDAALLEQRHQQEDDAAAIRAQKSALKAREAELQTREDAVRAGEAELGAQRAQLPRLRHQAAAEGREEGRREVEEALRRAEAAERSLEAERARLTALAAERPPMPTMDELLAAQSDLPIRFMKQARRKDGSTLHDTYETWVRAEHAKLSNWRRGASQVTAPYDSWRQQIEAVTVGEAAQRHRAKIEEIKARPSEHKDIQRNSALELD